MTGALRYLKNFLWESQNYNSKWVRGTRQETSAHQHRKLAQKTDRCLKKWGLLYKIVSFLSLKTLKQKLDMEFLILKEE